MRAWFSALLVALAMSAVPVGTSDVVGIYCLVQRVVMTPDEAQPTSVQVWGACASAKGGMAYYDAESGFEPGWYTAPFKGYLYYSAPAGREAVAAREWADLKRVAGTGEIVAFGARGLNNGRMRWADEKPTNPDVYPIHMGVTKITPAQRALGKPPYGYAQLFDGLVKAAGGK